MAASCGFVQEMENAERKSISSGSRGNTPKNSPRVQRAATAPSARGFFLKAKE